MLRHPRYQSYFDAYTACLWARASEFSRRAKESPEKRFLYRRKAKILSVLWRFGCLELCGAEITPSKDLLLYIRYGIWGLHCPFDAFDRDCRRDMSSHVAAIILGKDCAELLFGGHLTSIILAN